MTGRLRGALAKPDGILVQLRCRLLGHRWERCDDACCGGDRAWCDRCLAMKPWGPS